MNEANLRLKTGLFVVIGIAVLLVSIVIFGGGRKFFRSYNLYSVEFKSTQGLARGSIVSLSGIEVGNIGEITINEKSALVAQIKIDKEYAELITDQAQATIRTQGALGDKYIYVTPGEVKGHVIPPGGVIPSETEPDLIDLITQGKGPDFSVIFNTVRELNTLLNNLNANGASANLIPNFIVATQSLNKIMTDPAIHDSFFKLSSILNKIDRGDGTLGELVNDSTLYNRLVSLMGDEPRNKYLKPLIREAIKQNEKSERQR
jgi:phospholipid/cholesterol/gamma-HCH transport system substrate-binding protein